MIQILGLRVLKNSDSKYDAFFDRNWRAPSVPDLFKDLSKMLALIPKEEQWNLFYTLANCTEAKRVFKSQGVLAFDIDGIDFERREEYIPVVLDVLGLHRYDTGIVMSGNGLHFLVGLSKAITKVEFFKEYKLQYKIVCNKINDAMANAKLPGACDQVIFEPRRILRLPGTINRKLGKPERTAELLQAVINKVDFDLEKISGMPLVKPGDQMPDQLMKKKYSIDTPAVLDGCEFLKWVKDKPNDISEPQWYAALSIIGVLENEKELAHEYSRGHRNYSKHETDEKLAQSTMGYGPRTCENINTLWEKCHTCPNKGKVRSPVSLHSKGFIKTEATGFHDVIISADGLKVKYIPNFDDLRKWFEVQTNYRMFDASGIVYGFNGKFYEEIKKNKILETAQLQFNPPCDNRMAAEFLGRVIRSPSDSIHWWRNSVKDLINFENGILNLKTNEFIKHSPEYGFRFALPFDYDPNAQAPLFIKMLNTIFGNNQNIINVIMEYMGYSMMVDKCWAQKVLVFVGEGSNGKSTLMNVFKKIVGKENYTANGLKAIENEPYTRQLMDGKLLNICEETPTKALTDTSTFKALISGEDFLMRSPYKEPYTSPIIAKHIFSCNEIPNARDTTHGFFRRFLLIEFKHRFDKSSPDFDPFIEDKIALELPGVFNLALEGYKRLKVNQGFTKAKEIDAAISKYKEQTDTVQMWLKTNVAFFPLDSGIGKRIKFSDFFDSYVLSVRSWGEMPENKIKFSKRIRMILKDYNARHKEAKIDSKLYTVLDAVEYGDDAGLIEGNINSDVILSDK